MDKHQYYAGDQQAYLANECHEKAVTGRTMEITDEEFQAKLCEVKEFKEACGYGEKNVSF